MISFQTSKSNFLDEIVAHKQKEVANMRDRLPLSRLQNKVNDSFARRNFLRALKQSPYKPSLIAEVKKASPSKGVIRPDFNPVDIAQAYERGGAACLSVLCDRQFFQGGYDNLLAVRQNVSLPLLCKEFIIAPYQICWARACGADAVLLIAAILNDSQLQSFTQIIHSLGMEALVEVHTLEECDRALQIPELRLLGINNRNLDTFSVDLKTTEQILSQRREQLHSREITIVSESGLYVRSELDFVAQAGANAVLIGESLVRQPDVEEAVKKVLKVEGG